MSVNDELARQMRAKKAQRLYSALLLDGFRIMAYSGRGMYGKNCVATTDAPPVKAIEIAGFPKIDSLGLGKVYYWPECQWDDETMQEES